MLAPPSLAPGRAQEVESFGAAPFVPCSDQVDLHESQHKIDRGLTCVPFEGTFLNKSATFGLHSLFGNKPLLWP